MSEKINLPIVDNYVAAKKSEYIIGGYPKKEAVKPEPDAEDDLRQSFIHYKAPISESYISGSKKSSIGEKDSPTPVRDEPKNQLPKKLSFFGGSDNEDSESKGPMKIFSMLRQSLSEKLQESEEKLRKQSVKEVKLDDPNLIEQQFQIEEEIQKQVQREAYLKNKEMIMKLQQEMKNQPKVVEEHIQPKKVTIKQNCKRVKKIIFNQNKSQFVLIWKNTTFTQELDISDTYEIETPLFGFTLYDSQSLKEQLDFNHKSLLQKYNIIIKRHNLEVRHIALLFKTSMYAIVFEDQPNRVEFYDIDLQQSTAHSLQQKKQIEKVCTQSPIQAKKSEYSLQEVEEFAKRNLQSLTQTPDLDENGNFIINHKFDSIDNLTSDQIINFFNQDKNTAYRKYSIQFETKPEKKSHEIFPLVVKPKHMKSFTEQIQGIEYMNRQYLIYALLSKIYIYKGYGELHMTFATVSPTYSYCLTQNQSQLFKFAIKNNTQELKIHDFLNEEHSQMLVKNLTFPVSEFKMDSDGMRIVVLSQDGMYLYVYSTIIERNQRIPYKQMHNSNDDCAQLIQRFCRGSTYVNFCVPMQLMTLSQNGQNLHLAILCSSSGTIHAFRLHNDEEMYQELVFQKQKKEEKSWIKKLVDPVLPYNIKFGGSILRIHLTENVELGEMPYFAFVQEKQSLLSVICENGQYLKFSMQEEDLFSYQNYMVKTQHSSAEVSDQELTPLAKQLKDGQINFMTAEERMKIKFKIL